MCSRVGSDLIYIHYKLFVGNWVHRFLPHPQFAYKAAQCQLSSLHQGWKRVLVEGPEDHHHLTAVRQLESAVSLYLKKNSSAHNPKDIIAVSDVGVYVIDRLAV